jgi:S-adenosylmethionine:tRNA ribosyltransferase-isomerase
VRDLPEYLQPGDLLAFNDTRVIPARLFGQKESGGRGGNLIERAADNGACAQIGAQQAAQAGHPHRARRRRQAEVLGRDGELLRCADVAVRWRTGWRMPAGCRCCRTSTAIRAPATSSVTRPCSRASRGGRTHRRPAFRRRPAGGLHAKGIETGHVTLHVGAGTSAPMRVDDIGRAPHA